MKTMLRFVVENQATIAKVAVRDSGKTVTDAIFGEVLVTCEKLKWLAANGESILRNETRATGSLVWFTKNVWVEYRPLGVRSRRPGVLWYFHFVDVTRGHLLMKWVVSFLILSCFGPRRGRCGVSRVDGVFTRQRRHDAVFMIT